MLLVSGLLSQSQALAQEIGQSDWQTPGLSQPGADTNVPQNLGQSPWQNTNQEANQYQNQQPYNPAYNPQNNNQANWSNSANNYNQGQSFGQNANQPSLGQSDWQTPNQSNNNLGQSAWQQPQSAFQSNPNQSNPSDYYYGQTVQTNLNQIQPNNQNNQSQTWQTQASQQGQVQKSSGTLKQVVSGVTNTALTASKIAAPVLGMYLYGRALSRSPYSGGGYGMPYAPPYNPYGYGGSYPPMPYGGGSGMPYPGYGGMSSFMNY